ncbi:uncharacterized protein AMSG_11228 [Thecamonas trahens ATCC 50062]|uniref:Uncharacterized protein n=1 Tax=Thecamonas trahens ATCC 50062 TaxID=461836 RepID=A0A0L0DTY4_THETB|nr:hypothetical protein AMSG_11228 [Thecamonas trahens ATCC 50062]KNC55794.1 hypothetical protein AMSG_11228 [Thecamonas trahens ATCC 50062]|eukprot:XP_013752876.1 hypothetical protein AMSG_11228 [Thecamonas trahens ATCC 50062]
MSASPERKREREREAALAREREAYILRLQDRLSLAEAKAARVTAHAEKESQALKARVAELEARLDERQYAQRLEVRRLVSERMAEVTAAFEAERVGGAVEGRLREANVRLRRKVRELENAIEVQSKHIVELTRERDDATKRISRTLVGYDMTFGTYTTFTTLPELPVGGGQNGSSPDLAASPAHPLASDSSSGNAAAISSSDVVRRRHPSSSPSRSPVRGRLRPHPRSLPSVHDNAHSPQHNPNDSFEF